ncbi:MAG: hypothetical protein ACXAEB_03330 [Candidatus Thorarchaeota archaeon]|jgi:hypothetical protein
MAKKKAKKKTTLSPSLFKLTGPSKKMKVDAKKKKMYYFATKVKPAKAEKIAASDGAEILGTSVGSVKVSKPTQKYDFYCVYDADLEIKFLRLRKQEIGVNERVSGAMVGKEILKPKKGKTIPSKAIQLDIAELFELEQKDSMILDGKTGGPANAMARQLKGPGKKTATASWVKKNKISPGKYNSIDKVIRQVSKFAGRKPSDAKRVVVHNLTFKQLNGFYVPVYYVKVTAGTVSRILIVNGINGAVSLSI